MCRLRKSPEDTQALIWGACECCLNGKSGFADLLGNFKIKRLFGSSYTHSSFFMKGQQRESVLEKKEARVGAEMERSILKMEKGIHKPRRIRDL